MTDFLRDPGDSAEPHSSSLQQTFPSLDEIISQNIPSPIARNADGDVYTTSCLPSALDGAYIGPLLQQNQWESLQGLGSLQPNAALELLQKTIDAKLQGETRGDPVLYSLLAFCDDWLGFRGAAYWNLYRALELDPDNLLLLRARSLVVAIPSKPHVHVNDLTKLLALDPANADVYCLCRAFFSFLQRKCSELQMNAVYADLDRLLQTGFSAEADSRVDWGGFSKEFKSFWIKNQQEAAQGIPPRRKKAIEGLSALDDVPEVCPKAYALFFEMLQAGDYKAVITACTEALKTQPENPDIYLLRAYSYAHYNSWMSTPKKIADDLTSVLRYAPDHLIALQARGFMPYTSDAHCQQQIEDVSRLIELDPANEDTYLHHRSYLHYHLEDFEQACIDLDSFAEYGLEQEQKAKESLGVMRHRISDELLFQIVKKYGLATEPFDAFKKRETPEGEWKKLKQVW